ncbi:hypothetical protein [Chitinophaga sp. S165]|uniref:hypothetical protein n=1 Tax=Chitinophaga sp. S165 TaxID=2135462 RepID=UPI000D712533|nr:hypothetical protein [Chitinophaga sp. S165]PWV56098.1 hypothetical protein C7475_101612 [Chitinophaga sp. S165]
MTANFVKTRIISVPKDKDAEHALDYNEATPDQLIEIELTPAEFEDLYRAGVFDDMNEITDAMIDDYEYAAIVKTEELEGVLNSDIFNKDVANDKLAQIKVLFQEALERGTGVYFFF